MHSSDHMQAHTTGLKGWREALRWAAVAFTTTLALAAFPSHAAEAAADGASQGPVRVKLTQMRVEVEAGKEKLVPVDSAKPGDVIEYRAVYTNTSRSAVRDLTASLPIAEGLEYQAKSAKASEGLPAVQVAARDGKFGAEPLMVTEGEKKVAVPPAQYRVLRWRVGSMAAGGSVTVSARAQVSMQPIVSQAAPGAAQPR